MSTIDTIDLNRQTDMQLHLPSELLARQHLKFLIKVMTKSKLSTKGKTNSKFSCHCSNQPMAWRHFQIGKGSSWGLLVGCVNSTPTMALRVIAFPGPSVATPLSYQ